MGKLDIHFVAYNREDRKAQGGVWKLKNHKPFQDVVHYSTENGMYDMRFFKTKEKARAFIKEIKFPLRKGHTDE